MDVVGRSCDFARVIASAHPTGGGMCYDIFFKFKGRCGICRLHDVYSEPRTSRVCDGTSHSGAPATGIAVARGVASLLHCELFLCRVAVLLL